MKVMVTLYIQLNIILIKMPKREETAEERRARWMKRESERAEEGGRKANSVRCTKCGEEIEEFMEIRGRTLCMECYANEGNYESFSLP